MSKQLLLALGAGAAATAAVVASAATLGSVDSTDLGAGTQVVASCDSDGIDVSYTTGFSDGEYRVTAVTLEGIAATCATQGVKVTLYDADDDRVGEGSATLVAPTLVGTTANVDITVPGAAPAEDVTGVAVVISGDQPIAAP